MNCTVVKLDFILFQVMTIWWLPFGPHTVLLVASQLCFLVSSEEHLEHCKHLSSSELVVEYVPDLHGKHWVSLVDVPEKKICNVCFNLKELHREGSIIIMQRLIVKNNSKLSYFYSVDLSEIMLPAHLFGLNKTNSIKKRDMIANETPIYQKAKVVDI